MDHAAQPARPTVDVDLPVQMYVTVDVDSLSPARHHPHIPTDVSLLLPASSWARKDLPTPVVPAGNPIAADCGGFVAGRRAAGRTVTWNPTDRPDDPGDATRLFSFSPDDYLDWLARFTPTRPEWAATLDLPVEPALAPTLTAVRARQAWTSRQAAWLFDRWVRATGGWAADQPAGPLGEVTLIPTIQGRDADGPGSYLEHLAAMWPTISQMWTHAAMRDRHDTFRLGIGSLCARTDTDEIAQIVDVVANWLDDTFDGRPTLHLWGVKNRALSAGLDLIGVDSCDTAAWNGRFGRDIDRHNRERATLGLTQRAYGYRVQLPRYLRRLAATPTHTAAA